MPSTIYNKNKKVSIGIVGSGFWVDAMYLPALNNYSKCEIVGLAGNSEKSTLRLKDLYNLQNVYFGEDSYKSLTGIDGVIIASPTHTHYKIAKYFLSRGVHVLCEKPLTNSVSEADELVKLAKKNNCINQIAFTYSYLPEIRYLIEYCQNKKISTFNMKWLTGFMYKQSAISNKYNSKMGNSLIADVLSHLIYISIKMFGPVSFSKLIYSYENNSITSNEQFIPSELGGSIYLEFESGVTGTLDLFTDVACDSEYNMKHNFIFKDSEGNFITYYNDWNSQRILNMNDHSLLEQVESLYGVSFSNDTIADYKNVFRNSDSMGRRFCSNILNGNLESPSFEDGKQVQQIINTVLEKYDYS